MLLASIMNGDIMHLQAKENTINS